MCYEGVESVLRGSGEETTVILGKEPPRINLAQKPTFCPFFQDCISSWYFYKSSKLTFWRNRKSRTATLSDRSSGETKNKTKILVFNILEPRLLLLTMFSRTISCHTNEGLKWRKSSNGNWVEQVVQSSNGVCCDQGEDDWLAKLQEADEEMQLAMDRCLYPWHLEETVKSSADIISTPEHFEIIENYVHDSENSMNNCIISSYIQNCDLEDILDRLNNIESREQLLNKDHSKLCISLKKAHNLINEQMDFITFLEQEVSRLDQYGRRENIEILGIPARVSDKNLETEVVKILHKIGLTHITHYSIVGCHRIGNKDKYGPRSTIVRFFHRKDATSCIMNKKYLYHCHDLGYKYLSIVENLCPSYRSIFEDLQDLQGKGIISQYWMSNGKIKYKVTENKDENPIKVLHESELNKFYDSWKS